MGHAWHSRFADLLPGLDAVVCATLPAVTTPAPDPADMPELPRRLPDGSILANVSTMDDHMRLVDGVATIAQSDPQWQRLDEWLTAMGR